MSSPFSQAVLAVLLAGIAPFRALVSLFTVPITSLAGVARETDRRFSDASSAAIGHSVSRLPSRTAAAVMDLARPIGDGMRVLEGRLTIVSRDARNLTIAVGPRMLVVHVPFDVEVILDAAAVGLDRLMPAMRATFTFADVADAQQLRRIEVAP
jgi:hypothetical protein